MSAQQKQGNPGRPRVQLVQENSATVCVSWQRRDFLLDLDPTWRWLDNSASLDFSGVVSYSALEMGQATAVDLLGSRWSRTSTVGLGP